MRVKTSELTGPALDWAVALVEKPGVTGHTRGRLMVVGDIAYSPSNYWSQGGPIIEREGISPHGNPAWSAQYSVAVSAHHGGYRGYFRHIGPTPLIAAMRCFVASKLGDEVDVPEKLIS